MRCTYFCLLAAFLHWSETKCGANAAQALYLTKVPGAAHLLQESERPTQTHGGTDIDTDPETDPQTDSHTDPHKDTHTDGHRHTEA